MKNFIYGLYQNDNFTLILVIALVVLIIAFVLVYFFGKKDQKLEETKRLQKIELDAFKKVEEEPVKVSISAAGLRESLKLEKQAAREELASASEIDEMMKKMDGLSSQVINGNFSMSDRMNFQQEIKKLTSEISRAGGNGISFTKNDNVQLSQKISDLTRMINDAAVYHRNASAVFMVKNRQTTGTQRTILDIAI